MTTGGHAALRWLFESIYAVLRPAASVLLHRLGAFSPNPPAFTTDFFASDLFQRYTAAYSWQANQLGHLAIGLGLALLPAALAGLSGVGLCPIAPASLRAIAFLAGLLLFLIYLVKEVADALLEFGASRDRPRGLLQADAVEFGLDSATDAAFVLAGISLGVIILLLVQGAGAAKVHPTWIDLTSMGLFPASLGFGLAQGFRVIPHKRLFDASALPVYTRLERFNGAVTASHHPTTGLAQAADVAAAITKFCRKPTGIVVIFAVPENEGPVPVGRTTLACGLACNAIEWSDGQLGVRFTARKAYAGPDAQGLWHFTDEVTDAMVGVARLDSDSTRLLVVDDLALETLETPAFMDVVRGVRSCCGDRPIALVLVLIGKASTNAVACHAACDDLAKDLGEPVLSLRLTRSVTVLPPNRTNDPTAA